MDTKKAMEYIDAHREEILRDTGDLVRIPSVSDDPIQVRKALDHALELGRRMGFRARSVLDGQVGIIEVGEGTETLGILSHVDVVPPGDTAAWRTSPFEPVVMDGKLYGRGTIDDKGAIVVCLYAMKAVTELGQPLKKKIQMILGTQEEVEWTDMEAYVKEFPLPDYGFTPDGEFPVCNIEKGVADIELIIPLKSPEGEGVFVTAINGGMVTNVVPDHCRAELRRRFRKEDGTFDEEVSFLTGEGLAVHSCQPEKGKNAIINLCDLLNQQTLVKTELARLADFLSQRFSDVYCSGIGLYSSSEYFNGEYIHRNTVSPTVITTGSGEVRVNFNFRAAYGTSEEEIKITFEKIAAQFGGTIGNYSSLPAVYISKERPFMKVFAEAYETVTGLKNEFSLAYGGSYAKAINNIASWGPLFPGEEDTCHEENEYFSIDSLMLNGKIFAEAIGRIVLSDVSFK